MTADQKQVVGGVRWLATPSLTDVLKDGIRTVEQEDDEPRHKKRRRSSTEVQKLETEKFVGDLEELKSELRFLQDRCALLEEENRELKHGTLVDEEDDLVRLQLEALLTEKSKLAGENVTILRENQYLRQLVDYHQLLTSSQLSPPAMTLAARSCLRFSLSVLSEEDERSIVS